MKKEIKNIINRKTEAEDRPSIKFIVQMILAENPKARDDDHLLYELVAEKVIYYQYGITNIENIPLKEGLLNFKLPAFATVIRSRSQLQNSFEDLRGNLYEIRRRSQQSWINEYNHIIPEEERESL